MEIIGARKVTASCLPLFGLFVSKPTFPHIPGGVLERSEASQTPWKIKTNPKRISAGRFPYLTPNPHLGSQRHGFFPACKHDSLNWGLTGKRRGSAGGFAWTFISFSLPNSQFETPA